MPSACKGVNNQCTSIYMQPLVGTYKYIHFVTIGKLFSKIYKKLVEIA